MHALARALRVAAFIAAPLTLALTGTASAATNLALNRPTMVTSVDQFCGSCTGPRGNDGNATSRWSSRHESPERHGHAWWVDLGTARTVDRVVVNWQSAWAARYEIRTATVSGQWQTVATDGATGTGARTTVFMPRQARWVQVRELAWAAGRNNVSFYEAEVYNGPVTPDPDPTPTPTPTPSPDPTPSPTPAPTPPADPQPVGPAAGALAFRDEFTGTAVDWNRWTDSSHAEADGGHGNKGNQQLEWNQAANCTVSNGTLKETAKPDNITSPSGTHYDWSSCQIASTPSYSFRYGVIEMRAKLPAPRGFWTALWTWQVPGYNVWNEIDVFENYSNDHNWLSMSSHAGAGGNCTLPDAGGASMDLSAGFHTYTAAITTTGTRFYLDGQQTCSVAGTHTGLSNILVSNFVYERIPPTAGSVGVHEVDYVRAWRAP
jgi:hypothetical protein